MSFLCSYFLEEVTRGLDCLHYWGYFAFAKLQLTQKLQINLQAEVPLLKLSSTFSIMFSLCQFVLFELGWVWLPTWFFPSFLFRVELNHSTALSAFTLTGMNVSRETYLQSLATREHAASLTNVGKEKTPSMILLYIFWGSVLWNGGLRRRRREKKNMDI